MNQGKDGIIPTQQKANQVDLLVWKSEIANTLKNGQTMEIADTSKNGQIMEIADTPNNGHNEEDLVNEAIEAVITEELNAEANPVNGEIFIEAKEAVTQEMAPPEPEKMIKDYIPS
jgi:hypothetical protein